MDLKTSLHALKCEREKIEVGFRPEKKLVFPHVETVDGIIINQVRN